MTREEWIFDMVSTLTGIATHGGHSYSIKNAIPSYYSNSFDNLSYLTLHGWKELLDIVISVWGRTTIQSKVPPVLPHPRARLTTKESQDQFMASLSALLKLVNLRMSKGGVISFRKVEEGITPAKTLKLIFTADGEVMFIPVTSAPGVFQPDLLAVLKEILGYFSIDASTCFSWMTT